MMKIKILGWIILLFLALPAHSQTENSYKKDVLEKDLDFIIEKIKKVQNNPFLYCREEDFNKEAEKIRMKLPDSMTTKEFGHAVKPLLKMLGDEHARIFNNPFTNSPKSQKKEPKKPIKFTGLRYEKINKTGVLTVNHFATGNGITLELWKEKIDSLANRIRKDKIEELIVDVSHNGGGNSEVGNLLLAYFCPKDYYTYSYTWKRSDEYLEFMKMFDYYDKGYANLECGEYYTVPSRLVKADKRMKPFHGRLWVAVGRKTFSSAMIFATIVKDNKLGVLIGESPTHGHPSHFGEMIFLQAPETGLSFGFGVKHFTRPSGRLEDNLLEPDVELEISKIKVAEDWLPYLK